MIALEKIYAIILIITIMISYHIYLLQFFILLFLLFLLVLIILDKISLIDLFNQRRNIIKLLTSGKFMELVLKFCFGNKLDSARVIENKRVLIEYIYGGEKFQLLLPYNKKFRSSQLGAKIFITERKGEKEEEYRFQRGLIYQISPEHLEIDKIRVMKYDNELVIEKDEILNLEVWNKFTAGLNFQI